MHLYCICITYGKMYHLQILKCCNMSLASQNNALSRKLVKVLWVYPIAMYHEYDSEACTLPIRSKLLHS